MHGLLRSVLRDDGGAAAIEYGLIGGLIAIAIITAVTLVGGDLELLFGNVAAEISAAL